MREEFKDIVSGWALQSGLGPLTEHIEAAAEWTKANGPLEPDEEATIKLMIEAQIARSGFNGLGDDDGSVFTHCNVCGKRLREPEEDEMGMCIECANI